MISNKEILIKFGKKVREIRKEKGLSQEELSYRANLHRTYIGMIERAEKNITLLNIEKIAKVFSENVSSETFGWFKWSIGETFYGENRFTLKYFARN